MNFPGYVAPPSTASGRRRPYLHNGSVPTLELVLDSARRPTYWKRGDGLQPGERRALLEYLKTL